MARVVRQMGVWPELGAEGCVVRVGGRGMHGQGWGAEGCVANQGQETVIKYYLGAHFLFIYS